MRRVRVPRLLDETELMNVRKPTAAETKKQVWGQKDCTIGCVMALCLNREKNTERIIIGE